MLPKLVESDGQCQGRGSKESLSQIDGYLQWLFRKSLFVSSPQKAAARGKVRRDENKVDYSVHFLLTDLKNCRDLQWGKQIHAKASESEHESNMYVVTGLIRMYAKCGSMLDARRMFDSFQNPDVACWNALLLGYAENGDELTTLELFSKMKACGCVPSSVTYIAALKACTYLAEAGGQSECLKWGREIHSEIGCDMDVFVQSKLIDMYGKCGSMVDARHVFETVENPNVVCWNSLLVGYAENGNGQATLEQFSRMKACGCEPNSVTYIAALKACISLVGHGGQGYCLKLGRGIHSEIGCNLGITGQGTLIHMYGMCGSMVEARCVFESIQKPNVVCWNALLMGYVENGNGLLSLELFSRMKACGLKPNYVTCIAALKACTSLVGKPDVGGQAECLKRGKEIHSQVGCNLNISVQNTLIDMYSKCGSISDARSVFDSIQKPNVVSWNALLWGYADNGDALTTLRLFLKMNACFCAPNSVTYVAVLKACGSTGSLAFGRKLHTQLWEFNSHVVACLIDFYAKCGSIAEARGVFDAHSRERNISTWNALFTGYASFGDTDSVFNLFDTMQDQRFQPDAVTFVCMLSCCSHAGLVEKAREYFEAMPIQYGVTRTVMHYTCMVDVLGRSNQLSEAIAVIRKMPCSPDVVIWVTLLGACRKWKDVEIGRLAFKCLVDVDKRNAAAYLVMARIYSSRGMWEEQERLLEARRNLGSWELCGQAYVNSVSG